MPWQQYCVFTTVKSAHTQSQFAVGKCGELNYALLFYPSAGEIPHWRL